MSAQHSSPPCDDLIPVVFMDCRSQPRDTQLEGTPLQPTPDIAAQLGLTWSDNMGDNMEVITLRLPLECEENKGGSTWHLEVLLR
jgi:hypothetical protein